MDSDCSLSTHDSYVLRAALSFNVCDVFGGFVLMFGLDLAKSSHFKYA